MAERTTTICIIGCGGFIGSHLVDRLLARGNYRILGIDINGNKIAHCIEDKRFTLIGADIKQYERLRPHIEESDCVVSLAALCNPSLYVTIPLQVVETNFTHSLEIVRMCTELGKWLIHFSTSEVYGKTLASYLGPGGGEPKPEHVLFSEDSAPLLLGPVHAQRWIYACAKELLERIIYAQAFENGLAYTIVRPFNFIGPRMDYIPGIEGEGTPRVMACFMGSLLQNRPLQLVMGGKNQRVFTYIDDAVNAIELMIQRPESSKGQIFNVGNPGNEVSMKQLAHRMIEIYKELVPETRDMGFQTEDVDGETFYGQGYEDSDRRVPDISKARRLLGWQPQYDLDLTLTKTIAYYVNKYKRQEA